VCSSDLIRATWDAPDYPFVDHYKVLLWDMSWSRTAYEGHVDNAEWVSPAIQEGSVYRVYVWTVSAIGANSGDVNGMLMAIGKYLIPGDVPSITAFEVGGRVYLSWEPAVDVDIWRYRIKYGPVGGTYADAIHLNDIDGLRHQTGDIPEGTWTLYIVAVDSIRQESATPATTGVTVTLDLNAYLLDALDHSSPTTTGMSEYTIGPADTHRYWVMEDGETAASKFPALASTYTDIAATYHDGSASAWVGEAEDFGQQIAGNYSGYGSAAVLDGAAESRIELSPDASAWTPGVGLTALGTARFARVRHASDSGVMVVALDTGAESGQGVSLDAIPRTRGGSATSLASGPKTITLDVAFAAFREINITPQGTAPRQWVVDALTPGTPTTFDVYIFDASGTQVACDFLWTASGAGS
jgi:hypothetical protein